MARFLDPKGHFFKRHGEIAAFIVSRNGQPVGRLAAIINHTHNEYHRDRIGFFGFPAFKDDPQAIHLLFEAVSDFLKSRGLTQIRGPYSPSINEECGLLVNDFENRSFIGIPWNPDYYEARILEQNYKPVRELQCLLLDMSLPLPERVRRIVERIETRSHLHIRPIRMNKLDEDLKILTRLYNRTLDRNWGFVPMHIEDLRDAASDLRAVANPEGIQIVEMANRPAGFIITLPNINDHLACTKNTPPALRLLHLAYLLKTRNTKTARLTVLGIDPKFRARGINAWFFAKAQEWTSSLYTDTEISWVEANNTEIIESAELMGCKPTRTLRIFEKNIAA
ncbi:MAG: hypothetical protein ACK5NG_10725 [Chthoniobacterales bacterium]